MNTRINMMAHVILRHINNILKVNGQIGQLRTIYIIQLERKYLNNTGTIDNVCAKWPMTLSSSGVLLIPYNLNCLILQRWKHKKQKSSSNKYHSDDEDDDNNEDPDIQSIVEHGKNTKVLNFNVNSMRIDSIVKASLSMARNKAEITLYEGKLRVNEKKILKKGLQVKIGDYIDMVHGPSPKNDKFLLVTRITILDADINNDGYRIKVLREKSLIIENYDDTWKPINDNS